MGFKIYASLFCCVENVLLPSASTPHDITARWIGQLFPCAGLIRNCRRFGTRLFSLTRLQCFYVILAACCVGRWFITLQLLTATWDTFIYTQVFNAKLVQFSQQPHSSVIIMILVGISIITSISISINLRTVALQD